MNERPIQGKFTCTKHISVFTQAAITTSQYSPTPWHFVGIIEGSVKSFQSIYFCASLREVSWVFCYLSQACGSILASLVGILFGFYYVILGYNCYLLKVIHFSSRRLAFGLHCFRAISWGVLCMTCRTLKIKASMGCPVLELTSLWCNYLAFIFTPILHRSRE